MNDWLRVEFHCHTRHSEDSLTSPERLVEVCRRRGIDRVAVTDHDSIQGALEAQRLDPGRVIVGEEVMTARGELLALFVRERVPPGLSPEETIRRLRAQDAFISVSHPLDPWRGWNPAALLEILPLVDALEVFNARCMSPAYNRAAAEFALARGMPATVGSDAHAAFELGRATLTLPPFADAAGLRAALPHARAEVRWSPPWVHLTSRWAKLYKTVLSARSPHERT